MKSQITCKLDSIADKETEIIDLFAVCDMEYFEYDFQIYTQVEEDGDDDEFNEAVKKLGRVVEVEHKGRDLKLIFKNALRGAELNLLSRDYREPMSPRKLNGLLEHVDGWLVMSLSRCGKNVCFSTVRKKRWIAAGRPMVLDMRHGAVGAK